MIRIFVIFFSLFSLSTAVAQNENDIFQEANSHYRNGEYQKAISLYEQIISSGKVSSELYYNLGNCYYKTNKVGPSIFNYEKALLLNPSNKDAKNNLIFAKRLALDRIEELPKSVFQKFNESYLSQLTYDQWAIVSIVFSFLAALFFLGYYFTSTSSSKRFFFTSSGVSILFLILSLIVTSNQYSKDKNTVEAIIYTNEVSVKNEPIPNADEAFILHEGTKVVVLDEVEDWKKIRLADGKIGWLKAKDINLLRIF